MNYTNKKRRRHAFLMFSTLVFIYSLLSCTGNKDEKSKDEPISFSLWSRSDEGSHKQWEWIVHSYLKKMDNKITIDYPDVGMQDFDTKVVRSAAGKQLPDAIINDSGQAGNYVKLKLIQELQPSEISTFSEITSTAVSAAMVNNKLYGVPVNAQAFAVFNRKDWREKLGAEIPKSMEDLTELAIRYTEEDPDGNGENDTYGIAVPYGTQRGYVTWNIISFIWSNGGSIVEAAGDKFHATLNTPEVIQTMKWANDLVHKHNVVQPDAINANSADMTAVFESKKTGMIFVGPYMISKYQDIFNDNELEVFALPAFSNHKSAALAEGENLYITKSAKQKALALDFASYVASSEGQETGMQLQDGAKSVIRLSINKNVDSNEVYNNNPYWVKFSEIFSNSGRYVARVPNWNAFRIGLSDFFNSALATPDADIENIMSDANEEAEKILNNQGVGE